MEAHSSPLPITQPSRPGIRLLLETLNGRWHRRALQVFMAIVLAHWVEHILQAAEVFLLGWSRPDAGGALGLLWPWLTSSESLHYAYALIMLGGLAILRTGFTGSARTWWTAALVIQVWHHLEHLLLVAQAATHPFFAAAVPTSVAQLVVPRVELHLFYNAVVFAPMVVALAHQRAQRAAASRGPLGKSA